MVVSREVPMEEYIQMAMEAREKAYAPYSDYLVGACLVTKEGAVFTGCNIENRALTPGNCAERTAFFKAISEGNKEFSRIVIVGGKRGKELIKTTPCGVCRQVMVEFCDPETFEVCVATGPRDYEVFKLKDLLPHAF